MHLINFSVPVYSQDDARSLILHQLKFCFVVCSKIKLQYSKCGLIRFLCNVRAVSCFIIFLDFLITPIFLQDLPMIHFMCAVKVSFESSLPPSTSWFSHVPSHHYSFSIYNLAFPHFNRR